ncbi:hypothetical protein [Xenophilus sp. Marseille-Q4582]|uniref:hypothetical protein n=1 Tax=Xenophilus sp. Marseille-Q4582 TaxID=2866600 RepID=UPI001CE45F1E|nr:hypothetical protein [Xenophilus sp. Marseille-Q4582]
MTADTVAPIRRPARPAAPPPAGLTDYRSPARSRLIEIIARQLVNELIQERDESLPVRQV